MKIFKLGFTLAEALIAMAIVGVIAAITVPTVYSYFDNQELVLALKKFYVELDHSLVMLQTDNYRGNFHSSLLGNGGNANVKKFLEDNFQIDKDCGNSRGECFESSYRSIRTSISAFNPTGGYSVQLKGGASVYIIPETSTAPATVYVDVNGKDSPNMGGRDMFTLNIYDDYSIDTISPNDIKNSTTSRTTVFNNNCKTSTTGIGCFGKILEDHWKMKY